MILSVIIPTYNSQDTIIRAINSCVAYIDDIEIVIVDDGSKDLTTKLIENKYSHFIENGKIQLINANHGGAGNARNLGIENSKGEWIIFLDSDDEFLSLRTVLIDLNAFRQYSFDVLNYSINYKKKYGQRSYSIINGKALTWDNLGLNNESLKLWDSGPAYKAFRREFLIQHNIRFPLNIKVGEDLVFNQKCLQEDPDIIVKYGDIYRVIENKNSITHKIINQNILEDGVKLVQAVEKLNIKNELMNEFIAKNFISILVRFLKSVNSIDDIIFSLKQYKKNFKVEKAFLTFYGLKQNLNVPIIFVSWIIWKQPNMARVLFPPMKKVKY